MQQQIQSLKDSELTQVLADGFALLYHRRPKFPVTYLANYLKNYQFSETQKKKVGQKLSSNKKLVDQLNKKQQETKDKQKSTIQLKTKSEKQEKQFIEKISKTQYHQDILDFFCDWIQKKFNLTGVYIGELKNKKKVVNLLNEDSQEAHYDAQAPKLIYFQHASHSHQFMINQTLPLESLLGKLLTGAGQPEGEQPPAEGEQGAPKQSKPKDEIFLPTVVDNKQLQFFKYPRLGSFFGIGTKINSFLSNKLFDENAQRVSTYQKQHDEYQKLREQREAAFRQAYDRKASEGADEQQLERLQKQYQKQESQKEKPKLKQFDTIKRQFVFGFDTLGQDREISKQDQIKIKQYINTLKKCWEETQIEALKTDIDRHLKLADKIQAPHQQTYLKIIADQDKQVLTHQEVQKYKTNEKLMELEMDTVRVQKLRQYLGDQKYQPFLQQILKAKVLKFQEILKYWLIFTGKSKEQINYPGTNVLDYRKVKPFLSKDSFINQINNFALRGSKPEVMLPNYAKWERQQRNFASLQAQNVAAYNIYLAFILRYLQLAAKVRKADRVKRVEIMKQQRKLRSTKKRQNSKKIKDKEAKLQALRADSLQKQQVFDQEAWLMQYNEAEQNQLLDLGPEILDQIDRDLQNGEEVFPQQEQPVQNAQNVPPAE